MELYSYNTEWEYHINKHYILIDNDKVLGSVLVEKGEGIMTMIVGLFIQEEFRGMGYARSLMKQILNDFRESIYLIVNKNNSRAIDLYKEYNFEYWKDKEDDDNFIWMKRTYEL